MIREIIMTIMIIMTIEKTEDNVKTSNQIDKFCPELQSFWTNPSQKTCRGEATHATGPLHSGPLPGNALKRISEPQSKAL